MSNRALLPVSLEREVEALGEATYRAKPRELGAAVPREYDAIVRALDKTRNNVSRAARELGASRRTLQYRMKEYGIPKGRAGRPRRTLDGSRRRIGHLGKLLAIGGGLLVGGVLLFRR